MSVNLHAFRLFAEVARLGSFSRAAESLNISQPAVSKAIKDFEQQIGERLIERGAGGLTLTEAGKRINAHAQALAAWERAAAEEIAALRGLEQSTLRIGASTTVATYFLPPLLGAFAKAHPGVTLQIKSANTGAIAALLAARELDVALVEGPVAANGLIAHPWRGDDLVLIAAPSHPLVQSGDPVPPDRLSRETFIVREEGSGTRAVIEAALAERGVSLGKVLEVGDIEAIARLVASGLGVSIVSEAVAADRIALGALVSLPMQDFAIRRALSWLEVKSRQPSGAARAFQRLLTANQPAKATI